MLNKKIMILAIFLVSLLAISAVSAADNSTEEIVSQNSDNDDNVIVEETNIDLNLSNTNEDTLKENEQTFTKLNEAINGNAEKNIYLKNDYKYSDGDSKFKKGIEINRDVNIYGNGHIIDGNYGASIFKVNSGKVVFYNITFTHGNEANADKSYGGAIIGGTAVNCTFIANTATQGGAIYNGYAISCTFIDNQAAAGGALYNSRCEDCEFVNNSAEYGGAIFGESASNSIFTSNRARCGGAIYEADALNCTFTSNSAGQGGAVFGGSAVNSTFTNNSATIGGAMYEAVALNSILTNNSAGQGGAMFGGSAVNCILTKNSAGQGGAMFGGSAVNSSLTANSAGQGGAMFGGSAKNTTFNSNQATVGGAIYNCSAINCTLAANNAEQGGAMLGSSAINSTFNSNGAWYGGAICNGSAVNCIFNSNSANQGGAMLGSSAANCEFNYNNAYSGGAICNGAAVNCKFNYNHASTGGAMCDSSAMNCTFRGNKAGDGFSMYRGYSANCTSDKDSDFYGTKTLKLKFNVENSTLTYNPNNRLLIELTDQSNKTVGLIDIDVVIYNNGNIVKYYSCLSGDKLRLDLSVGNYTAELNAIYPGLNVNPINITITINKATPNIEVSADDVTYPDNPIVNVKSDVGGTYVVKVGKESKNITLQADVIHSIAFSGLAINEAGYIINVTYSENENYTDATNDSETIRVKKGTIKITAPEVIAIYNTNKDLVITLKDGKGRPVSGINVTVDLNGAENYTTDDNGQIKISTKGLAANIYDVSITFNGTDGYWNCSNTTRLIIYKETSRVETKPLTTVYNVYKYLVIGLKDDNGNPIRNVDAFITINGVTYKCSSDDKGDARLIIRLKPKTYTAKITFDNDNYMGFTQYVTVIVLKATPKLTAKKKTFKAKKKTKKYTATLKDNKGKAIKKAKLTIKIGKKTYNAKTNAKGKAVFKIKKLTKKGKYTAKITYKGNYLYKKATKKVKIIIK